MDIDKSLSGADRPSTLAAATHAENMHAGRSSDQHAVSPRMSNLNYTHSNSYTYEQPRSHGASSSQDLPISQDRIGHETWKGALARLQAQVSYSTGMLESHRRQFNDVESSINQLRHEVHGLATTLNDIRVEMHARAPPAEPVRPDDGVLEVFASQLQGLTNRIIEVDGLNVQMSMLKNRVKRIEDSSVASSNSTATAFPSRMPPSSNPRDGFHDSPTPHNLNLMPSRPAAQQMLTPQSQATPSQPSSQPGPHMSVAPPPPATVLASMPTASSEMGRQSSYPGPANEPQTVHALRSAPPAESRPPLLPGNIQSHGPSAARDDAAVRSSEPQPTSAGVAGWRPAERYGGANRSPATAPTANATHPHAEPETHASGWAAVNSNSLTKRALEERRSPYGSPMTDGTKRPKLAPLMPNMQRSGDDHYAQPPSSHPPTSAAHGNGPDSPYYQPGRIASDGPMAHSQPPPSAQPQQASQPATAMHHNFRFITSTTPNDPHEAWRVDHERVGPQQGHHGPTRGRGRGRGRARGRGRGGGLNGNSVIVGGGPSPSHEVIGTHAVNGHGIAQPGPHGRPHSPRSGPLRHGPPEVVHTEHWDKHEWGGSSHTSPRNGYAYPSRPYSPPASGPPGTALLRRLEGSHFGPGDRASEYPATPMHPSPSQEPYGLNFDNINTSSGKKTRTKPFRNAEGVLIRKDGRPDMRSVSSANNLRKVHSKKEGDLDGTVDGDGTRSGTPNSMIAGGEGDHSSAEPETAPSTTSSTPANHPVQDRVSSHLPPPPQPSTSTPADPHAKPYPAPEHIIAAAAAAAAANANTSTSKPDPRATPLPPPPSSATAPQPPPAPTPALDPPVSSTPALDRWVASTHRNSPPQSKTPLPPPAPPSASETPDIVMHDSPAHPPPPPPHRSDVLSPPSAPQDLSPQSKGEAES